MFQTFLRAESGRWGFSFARRTRGKGFLSIKANPAKTRGIVEIERGWSGIFLFPRTNSIVSFISLDETREFTLRTATIFVLKRDTRMQMLVETVSFYFRMENFINFLFFLFCWNNSIWIVNLDDELFIFANIICEEFAVQPRVFKDR